MSAPEPYYRAGMVVEATVEVDGRIERRNFFRTRYLPNPWVAEQDVRDRAYYADDDLADVIVLYTSDSARRGGSPLTEPSAPAYLTLREGVQIAVGHLIEKGLLVASARGYADDLLRGVIREWLYDLPERDGLTGGSEPNLAEPTDASAHSREVGG